MGEGTFPKVDGDVLFASETNTVMGLLGQIIQVDISRTNAVNKAYMQGQGWAICDGTTPASQGISDATITTTPDLRSKFLRHSADETTGGTGGTLTHNHQWANSAGGAGNSSTWQSNGSSSQSITWHKADNGSTNVLKGVTGGVQYYTKNTETIPPYYDICYFIKVK